MSLIVRGRCQSLAALRGLPRVCAGLAVGGKIARLLPMHGEDQQISESGHDGAAESERNEALVLQRIIFDLAPLTAESRRRMIDTVSTFFGIAHSRNDIHSPVPDPARSASPSATPFRFSESEAPSPRDFMHEKSPTTDVVEHFDGFLGGYQVWTGYHSNVAAGPGGGASKPGRYFICGPYLALLTIDD